MKGQLPISKMLWFALAAAIFILSFWLLGNLFVFGNAYILDPNTAYDNSFGILVIMGILLFGAIFLIRIAMHTFQRSWGN